MDGLAQDVWMVRAHEGRDLDPIPPRVEAGGRFGFSTDGIDGGVRPSTAAWDAYSNGRKSPLTRKAGPGFADPDYDLAADWLAARDAIRQASANRVLARLRALLLH
jgi:hypothetical protein